MNKQTVLNKKIWIWIGVAIVGTLLVTLVYKLFYAHPLIVEGAFMSTFDVYSYPQALSPDGSIVYEGLGSYYLLEDSTWHTIDWGDTGADLAREFTSISPTGRFMTASYSKNYLLDTKENSCRDDAFLCKSWSSDGLRCIDINGRLVDILKNQKIEEWDNNIDFTQVKNVSGNGDYLWDEDRKIPIAFIVPCPLRDEKTGEINKTSCELQALSKNFNPAAEGYAKPFLETKGYDTVVDWTFSPNGKYILLAIWEQSPHPYNGLQDFSNSDFVTDTRLVLVDWRTGKTFALARLSQFIPEHPVSVYFGNMQWSADGNTIIVPIDERGELLVLKIKHP